MDPREIVTLLAGPTLTFAALMIAALLQNQRLVSLETSFHKRIDDMRDLLRSENGAVRSEVARLSATVEKLSSAVERLTVERVK